MYKNIRTILLASCLSLLSACAVKPSIEKQFNAYLPMSFDDFFEETVLPMESKSNPNTDVWNTDDVDISYIHPQRKLVAFTFDDAPAKTLENILAVFAEYNESNPDCIATATLFINGGFVTEESIPTLHASMALGFELGNHTQSHLDLTELSAETLQQEIRATDDILYRIDGKARHLLRPPFGHSNDFVKAQANVPIFNWTIDTLDWTEISAERIYDTVINNLFSGAIVLMHDGYPYTVQAVKRLLPDLKEAGYQVVGVSALAKAHGCTLRNGSEYVRLRKQ